MLKKTAPNSPKRRRCSSFAAVDLVGSANRTFMVSVSLPKELILEILKRLPAKSVKRFHCVSKQWASMLSCPHFRELFLTRSSSAQPRLLFAIEKHNQWSLFSLPQRLTPYEKSSSSSVVVTPEFHMKFPPDGMLIYPRHDRRFSFGYASGLMYFYGMWINEHNYDGVPVICNPLTGRYASLPFLERYRKAFSFFGFDPIEKQYKVLFMAYPSGPDHHTVLTFGTGEMSWRKIECSVKHDIASDGICINGVMYYLGDTSEFMTAFVVVCFDVRSETFSFIYPGSYCEVINYKGKLGLVFCDDYTDDAIELRLWVLEDKEKIEWSKYAYKLKDEKFSAHYVSIVGVSAAGEIVLSMADFTSKQPFYVFYYNPERNTLQCTEIQGFEEHHGTFDRRSRVRVFVDDCSSFYRFADHVEYLNVDEPKLLKSKIYDGPNAKIEWEEEEEEDEDEDQEKEEEDQWS
ncbi:F-box protein [Arabidopsis thaliana]|uniref:F-box domain-containing protein n=2 Tax=Arabidopsis TaxID=3701 RepID=A0A178WE56_ARATH|nr:F-box domain [Arabidopsis thaliana x Arabidopsis arenosa]OAP15322.1 hypothetical protein AXX17_AT1G41300 [Arabidopsis thaliana]